MEMIPEISEETRDICPIENQAEGIVMSADFQVAAVKKPLMAVKRISEKGNHVGFGPGEDDNFVVNAKTGNRIKLYPRGNGSYVMKVKFLNGIETEIAVDSGAEENVCPYWWGKHFGIRDADTWLNLTNASGDVIPHYGTRTVQMTAPF